MCLRPPSRQLSFDYSGSGRRDFASCKSLVSKPSVNQWQTGTSNSCASWCLHWLHQSPERLHNRQAVRVNASLPQRDARPERGNLFDGFAFQNKCQARRPTTIPGWSGARWVRPATARAEPVEAPGWASVVPRSAPAHPDRGALADRRADPADPTVSSYQDVASMPHGLHRTNGLLDDAASHFQQSAVRLEGVMKPLEIQIPLHLGQCYDIAAS